MRKARISAPADLAALPEEELLEAVQRQTFGFFWEAGHPVSGLAPDRCTTTTAPADDLVATGGSGFGVMAHIVAAERGWVSRAAATERIGHMLELLNRATCYHGVFPHFMNGRTGATIPFSRKDDGGDLVETSFLMMGLLCAREYFKRQNPQETKIRGLIDYLWAEVEWSWYTRGGTALQWHWSPNNGWALDHEIRGWNECLVTYVLAASAPRYFVSPRVYHQGFAVGRNFLNGKSYYDVTLPLGAPFGGPLFFVAVFVLRNRPPGIGGSLCRLLATKRQPRAHQSRPLREEPAASQGIRRILLGPHCQRRSRRLCLARPGYRQRHYFAHRRHIQHALCAEGSHPSDASLPQSAWR